MKFICAMLLLFSIKASAQYPFEKYPALKCSKVFFKTHYFEKDSSKVAMAKYGNYLFTVNEKRILKSEEYNNTLSLYFKKELIFKTEVDINIFWADESYPLCIADINGDGLVDFKITYPNAGGSGLAGSRVWKLYLFNKGNHKFHKVTFGDFYSGNKEYDLNNDGNYELIGQHYVSYKNHSYWAFDLYNYLNGRLVNVSSKNNYPIMVRFLAKKESYKIIKNISLTKMKTFSAKLPEFYEHL